jgi:hypothetical protein
MNGTWACRVSWVSHDGRTFAIVYNLNQFAGINWLMRRFLFAIFAICTISLFAQEPPPPGPPGGGPRPASFKNLKILKPEEVRAAMGSFVAGTGMKCADCHVQGTFDSDEKPQKVTARKMLEMVRGVKWR